ncbi:MAG: beta family protein [Candidatus Binatia bacterium]
MFDHKHYVPIIPWKMGERIALRELFESDRQGIVPLIEIPQNFVDKKPIFFETGRFIHSMLPEIASYWGDGLAFVDLHALARLSSTNVTRHIETFFRYSAEVGLKLCPVVKVQLPDFYGEAICKAVESTQAMCLRVHVKDFEGDAITSSR